MRPPGLVEPRKGVPLAPLTTMGVGGSAAHLAEITSEAEALELACWAREQGLSLRVLGGGSNVLVSDDGVDGLVMLVGIRGITLERTHDGVIVTAGAGEEWDELTKLSVDEDLQGIECLAGIPGRVGATPIQNVGAYGQEVSETIESVRALDLETMRIEVLSAEQCEFSYRDSYFKSRCPRRYVVLSVRFRLRPGAAPHLGYGELQRRFEVGGADAPAPALAEVREAVVELRRAKSMVLDPTDENGRSCGSFFVNALVGPADVERITIRAGKPPPQFPQVDGRIKVPSAWLIEQAGLTKGTQRGSVGLSTKHTLSIVARDGARAADVVGMAAFVRQRVEEHFGVRLVPEPEMWGFGATIDRLPALD